MLVMKQYKGPIRIYNWGDGASAHEAGKKRIPPLKSAIPPLTTPNILVPPWTDPLSVKNDCSLKILFMCIRLPMCWGWKRYTKCTVQGIHQSYNVQFYVGKTPLSIWDTLHTKASLAKSFIGHVNYLWKSWHMLKGTRSGLNASCLYQNLNLKTSSVALCITDSQSKHIRLLNHTLRKKGCRNSTPTGAIWLSII